MKQHPSVDQVGNPSAGQLLKTEYLGASHVLELLPVAVFVCDGSGAVTLFNQKAADLFGALRDKQGFWDVQFYDGLGKPIPHDVIPSLTSLKDGKERNNRELQLGRPDGSRIMVDLSVLPVKDEHGNILGTITSLADITGKKEAEQLLLRKANELQDYVDHAAIGLHWVDSNGIIIWANQAELDMLGYTAEEYIGHHIAEFHAAPERIQEILSRLGCDETLKNYEAVLRCRDGSVKMVHISSNVYRENGVFVHTRCFTVDISEQKRLFQALAESESRYRQMVEGLRAAVFTTDAQGHITLFNLAAKELWGREPDLANDRWCGSYKLLHADGSEVRKEDHPMAIAVREKRQVDSPELVLVRPDGSRRLISFHPKPLFDAAGNVTGAVNMLVDVTDVRRSEDALREREQQLRDLAVSLEKKVEERTRDIVQKNEELKKSEERYHKMIEEVEDYAIVLLDRNGIIQNWNKGAEKIKGYKEEEIVGKSFKNFYTPEDQKKGLAENLINRASQTGKAIHEGWRMRKDGTRFWGSIVITALHNASGEVIGFSKVTRDLTERKLAEDKLRDYTNELEFQNKELEQFAYAASHDMKEPLRKIHFYNSFIYEHAGALDEKSKEYLNRSIGAVRRMGILIEDLLTYSRNTYHVDHLEKVDVNEVVEEVVLLHKEEFEQKKVKLDAGRLPVIQAVPFQFKQLLDNLISNSIKYKHPDRDVHITITADRIKGKDIPQVEAEAAKNYFRISVSDNGVGFDQQYSEKIFEIFQRLNNHPETQGSGIGLAICKKIVQNHKGFVRAWGKQQEGARFDVYIPE